MNRHSGHSRKGALVISLDLELQWGVRDHPDGGRDYAANLHGARVVVPELLELFEGFGIAATWATVGFLFARSRRELERFSPEVRPGYREGHLSPYSETVGKDEAADPLHYAPSLVARIQRAPRQEIATHTYSHYFCGEDGQTREEFRADLSAACAIAREHGIRLRSIVFPRNQHNPDYDDILAEAGIRAYRGNPRSPFWQFSSTEESRSRWKRAGRFVDTYLGLMDPGTVGWTEIPRENGLSNVRASCFLTPYRPRLAAFEKVRLARMRQRIRAAARAGEILHLWWHPHNFGVHREQNLAFLRTILMEYARCRDQYGMESLTMGDVDARVREGLGEPHSALTRPTTQLPPSSRSDE